MGEEMTTKQKRRKLHAAINSLEPETVASIVRKVFPRTLDARVDQLAKAVIANAHRHVSPRLPRKTR
jgi:hypothetical protein